MPRNPERRGSRAKVLFLGGKLEELRGRFTWEELAAEAGLSAMTLRRARRIPVTIDTAIEIALALKIDYRTITVPFVEAKRGSRSRTRSARQIKKTSVSRTRKASESKLQPTFRLTAILGTGANERPDPSGVEEGEGYKFCFEGYAEATMDCSVINLRLDVVRNDHVAICTGPGKSHFYHGPLMGNDTVYGFVSINGESFFVDADYRLKRPYSARAHQKFALRIERWCRAIGLSRGDKETASIEYWVADPHQIISVEYLTDDCHCREKHTFAFAHGGTMILESVEVAEIQRLKGEQRS